MHGVCERSGTADTLSGTGDENDAILEQILRRAVTFQILHN
jgi:hypothetical protein